MTWRITHNRHRRELHGRVDNARGLPPERLAEARAAADRGSYTGVNSALRERQRP